MQKLAICLVLVGCGGDGGGGEVAVDDLGIELALVSCRAQFGCCTDAELMAQYMGITYNDEPITTEEQCVEFANALLTSLAVAQYKESIAKGRVEYDAAAAGECVAALESLTCTQYSMSETAAITAGCRPFLTAKVEDGGACLHGYECTSRNCEGASNPIDGPSTDGMCKPLPTAGQPCDETCADGLYCAFDASAGMDICHATQENGTQCNLDRECTSDYCDEATDTCATAPPTCDGR